MRMYVCLCVYIYICIYTYNTCIYIYSTYIHIIYIYIYVFFRSCLETYVTMSILKMALPSLILMVAHILFEGIWGILCHNPMRVDLN